MVSRAKARVIKEYQAPYPNPIVVNAGEEVAIDNTKVTDISGWVWCTSLAGKSGWVPKAYIDQRGKRAFMRCDYDAIELTINEGDILSIHKSESDFCWVSDASGHKGWVPSSHIEIIEPQD